MVPTKFRKSKKIEPSNFLFQTIQFCQIQNRNREGAKRQDLKILGYLRHGRGARSTKES
jgi:hypothetical protein